MYNLLMALYSVEDFVVLGVGIINDNNVRDDTFAINIGI